MLHTVAETFLWLLGLCVGSFLNVVIYRLNIGLSIAEPRRSFCPHCRASIAWYDNIPLLSWLLLGGRCRRCGAVVGTGGGWSFAWRSVVLTSASAQASTVSVMLTPAAS